MMTRAVRGESGHPHEEKTNKLGRTLRPLFIFQDNGKTNKSIVMPDPNFRPKIDTYVKLADDQVRAPS